MYRASVRCALDSVHILDGFSVFYRSSVVVEPKGLIKDCTHFAVHRCMMSVLPRLLRRLVCDCFVIQSICVPEFTISPLVCVVQSIHM
jgi:hypothetical protein